MTPAEFTALTGHVPYAKKGMFFSELYLFLRACADSGVTFIVESGVSRGVSTRVLNAAMPGKVTSVTMSSLIDAPGPMDIRIGDGVELVPTLIEEHAADRVGVLLDGPKGEAGRLLKDHCLRFPNVAVIGAHDQRPGLGERWHSHDRGVQHPELDERIPADIRRAYPHGCPGLGVWTR